jgi:magnesium transporter
MNIPFEKYAASIFFPSHKRRKSPINTYTPYQAQNRTDAEKTVITVFDYNHDVLQEKKLDAVEECYPYLKSPKVTWLNVDGLRRTDVLNIAAHYEIHPLLIEDILSMGQRAKMDDINNKLFCLLPMLYYNDQRGEVEMEQVSIILGDTFVISFQEDPLRDVFNPIRERLRLSSSKLRAAGADFLFYSLLDIIVDNYFVIIEKLGSRVELIEDMVMARHTTRTLAQVSALRREILLLKKSIAPVRELINGILKSESELIDDKTLKYIKDVYDHIVQANDLAESYRDMLMYIQDLYMNQVNLKMNEVMKVLAIVTTLLAPATVIGGIFGMNFDKIPFAHHPMGFYISVTAMFIIPIIMLYIFKRRRWF